MAFGPALDFLRAGPFFTQIVIYREFVSDVLQNLEPSNRASGGFPCIEELCSRSFLRCS